MKTTKVFCSVGTCTSEGIKTIQYQVIYSSNPAEMATLILLVIIGALAQCAFCAPPALRANHSEVFAGFDLKQRIAYRIGQVECLKTLLSQNESRSAQYGLGSLHRGDYASDITRFGFKQRIAFLLGQVQCLKIHLTLEKGSENNQGTSNQQPTSNPKGVCIIIIIL